MGELDALLPRHVAEAAANFSSDLGLGLGLGFDPMEANCSNDDALAGECNVTMDADECVDAEYYAFSYSMVGTVLQSAIFVVGVVGNVLVCSVVRRMRSMHSTTNCYLVSLAVADTITLLASVPQEVLSYHILGDQWVWGPVGCTLMIYLQYLGIDASALSLTAFTVERYIAICHPMKSKSICTLSRAKKIIACCWIFAILYCSPWFLLTTTRTLCVKDVGNITTCRFRLRRDSTEYLVMFFADLMIFYVIPLLLSVVLYSLIARMLLTSSRNKFHGSGMSNGGAPTTLSVSEAAMKSNQSRVQVVKMLACVVFIFATLWVPYRGLLVYNSFATMNQMDPFLDLWYLMFAKTCVYMNCAINPILYNAMSDKFRKAFQRQLSCGVPEADSNIQRYRFAGRTMASGRPSGAGFGDSTVLGRSGADSSDLRRGHSMRITTCSSLMPPSNTTTGSNSNVSNDCVDAAALPLRRIKTYSESSGGHKVTEAGGGGGNHAASRFLQVTVDSHYCDEAKQQATASAASAEALPAKACETFL